MHRRSFLQSIALLVMSPAATAVRRDEPAHEESEMTTTAPTPTDTTAHDPRRDFDFLFGATWKVHNRRLKERLRGSTEWIEFSATNTARSLLNGLGNEDEFRTEHWPNFVGMSFRFFDPRTRRWAIHWADSIRGTLEPPVFGTFHDGVGVFEGVDSFEGRPIRVRFTWSRTDTPTPRWEQAFSADDGATWETNWIMDFSREHE